ncbi:coiled-coil domain-containing protein 66 isoform X2 [Xenopus laevis]|uniref:Coiled-coil domain-containing protein 66 isoform X2 n=1 Tax=Xenopus laevis TaxID=8355 RepID=A0A8J0TVW6_XENLA|nr:coiled-coil domain-containing protein 66 isoform X2 [Xenopus laevis]
MNLGDGLKLETQILDGKTRLILAPYGSDRKSNKQAGNRGRTQKVTQPSQVLKSVQSNNVKPGAAILRITSGSRDGQPSKPLVNVLKQLENKHQTPVLQQNVQPHKQDPGKAKAQPKKPTHSGPPNQRGKQRSQPKVSAEQLRDSLVCLTQEQFQHILMTINQGNRLAQDHGDNDEAEEPEEGSTTGPAQNVLPSPDPGPTAAELSTHVYNTRVQGDLFSTLGERERDRGHEEAKKAQWRKELDEQIAMKKKLRGSAQGWPYSRHQESSSLEPSGSDSVLPPSQTHKDPYSSDNATPAQDDVFFGTSTSTETSDSSPIILSGPSGRGSSFSSPELPAAIRSAFVLGEAAPLDHPFSAIKRQQQKKWLEELNKQRDEAILRKKLEKKKMLEREETEKWAMHFDSFKKISDPQTQVPHNTVELAQPQNLLPAQQFVHSTSAEPITSPDLSPTQRAEAEQLRSSQENQKTGFLRTMTALLDPVQIEEREKKRLKQLEHQKAIAAQVEEKRRRKQLEEEQRLREEQEEEQKLAMEREHMQRQFEEDTNRQKQKEEILNVKTKELYESMQRAQEEAQRIKQQQRMRHLEHKGNDISKLQRNPTTHGEAVQMDSSRASSRIANTGPSDPQSVAKSAATPMSGVLLSPRKDTAVQTDEIDRGGESEAVLPARDTIWRQSPSPEVPIEFQAQSRAETHVKKLKSLRERSSSRKENKDVSSDYYEQFARAERQTKELAKKPDWNKNKPPKRFVPASERYPKGLQRQREESRVRRQNELMNLVEKNALNNLQSKKGNSPQKSLPSDDTRGKTTSKKAMEEESAEKVDPYIKRSDSPPVPAVKNRMHQSHKRHNSATSHVVQGNTYTVHQKDISPESSESERPPSSNFIPYVRTKEIYYLDPDAPMSRPSTHDPQYKRTGDDDQTTRQIFSSDQARDPLLNPSVVKNKDRQQAILKGLSELRKGLLQKQKELETGLMPDI